MPDMLKIFQEVFSSTVDGLTYPITETEFKGRYYQAACNLQCFYAAINPFHRFMTNMKDDMDGLSVLAQLDERKTPEAYFAGIFPVHACLNHSCENNAEVSNGILDGHYGIQVTAKRAIKKGEEVYINYINTAIPKMLRRAWLFKSFDFWCHCRRCRFEGDQPIVCTQCGAKSNPDKKKSSPLAEDVTRPGTALRSVSARLGFKVTRSSARPNIPLLLPHKTMKYVDVLCV